MTQKTSLVGGIISISAVILLSFLSQGVVEEGGFIQRMLFPLPEDSIDALEGPDTLDLSSARRPQELCGRSKALSSG